MDDFDLSDFEEEMNLDDYDDIVDHVGHQKWNENGD